MNSPIVQSTNSDIVSQRIITLKESKRHINIYPGINSKGFFFSHIHTYIHTIKQSTFLGNNKIKYV